MTPPNPQRDVFCSLELEQQFQPHAPRDPDNPSCTKVSDAIRQSILNHSGVNAIVLTADIRRSASILKESIDIMQYAKVLDDFVAEFRTVLSYHGGWFDKFTGDGFICYWLIEKGSFIDYRESVLDFAFAMMDNFRTYYYPCFVANMRNVPTGIGLTIGMDAGPCYLMPIAGDLTLIGSPIVGSVRMSSSGKPYHLILNSYPGSQLIEETLVGGGRLTDELSYTVAPISISTKEYPECQVAYSVEFFRKGKRQLF